MFTFRDAFNKISVSLSREFNDGSYNDIPRREYLFTLVGEETPQTAGIEACCIDVQKFQHYFRACKVEFLEKGVNFSNEIPSFSCTVLVKTVVILLSITKVVNFIYPWKWDSLQMDFINSSFAACFLAEIDALDFLLFGSIFVEKLKLKMLA